jgi:hypothetical protein
MIGRLKTGAAEKITGMQSMKRPRKKNLERVPELLFISMYHGLLAGAMNCKDPKKIPMKMRDHFDFSKL